MNTDYNKPENWENWFLTVKNRHNSIGFPIENPNGDETYFTEDRQHWKIYLTVHLKNGMVFQTSNIVEYDEDKEEVKTFRGSVYKLGEPLNDYQKENMKKYFAKDEYHAFDARI